MKGIREKSTTYYILTALEKATEGYLSLDQLSYTGQMKAFKGIKSPPKKSSFLQSISRLKKKGLIDEEIKRDGEVILKLTSLGRNYFGEKEEEWDGVFRIVAWDIPEKKRNIRNQFRYKLRGWGFVYFQDSVWVSKKNVTVKLRKLIRELGLEKNIVVIESKDKILDDIIFLGRRK